MNRRKFITKSAIVTAGPILTGSLYDISGSMFSVAPDRQRQDLYELFRNPGLNCHPFVRWWWNGNMVEAGELIRELRLLKDAGIGGVEINPVEFPERFEGDDLGKRSLKWLSDEWIAMLKVTFDEARSLGLTCDLIVGSGWPFGSEHLKVEERSQIVVIGVRKLKGPLEYEISEYEIFREADPAISSPFPGRTMELLSLHLVADPLYDFNQVIDLSDKIPGESFRISIPEGKHALYGMVKINGFMQVINGAPGATGPVLDHYNVDAVRRYLTRMSETIEKRIGPLSGRIRAMFIDSMELEGSNWSSDIPEEFRRKRGYDLLPFLPFILFRTGAMGNVTDFRYGVEMSPQIESEIKQMRYDFELTKAELLEERFIKTFVNWCRELKVHSRAQAYGRSFFPLESSFHYDIPESESWTMNWLKHKIGEEMPEDDYRRGRAYTMINKYVSSAANLTGKHIVSCEEMTDTYTVFNTTLENLKIGSDQSTITGVTHSILHGFNYSPPEAPYPGWLRYGGYYNENNTWWPWFHLYNRYKGRMSALLQNVTMFSDIAVLPPLEDMWSNIGAQMEPFPSITHVEYLTLVWESINKNGNGCDYVSQKVIRDAEMKNGMMNFGPKKYHTIFLIQVDSLHPATAQNLARFIESGGRVICIETLPSRSPGWKDHESKTREIAELVEKMKSFPERFILIRKPEKDFIGWYKGIQERYGIAPHVKIGTPDPYIMQNRYQGANGEELLYIIHSHLHKSHLTKITFSRDMTRNRQGWIWDPEDGNRYRIILDKDNSMEINLGPAASLMFVFDGNRQKGPDWIPSPPGSPSEITVTEGWSAEFSHCRDGSVKKIRINKLQDLMEMPEFVNFAGIVTYYNSVTVEHPVPVYLNLGKVYGTSELTINGKDCGTKWYGRRIFNVSTYLKPGINEIAVKVATSMGNYMKSLTENRIAQYWTNEKNKIQPLQSMGLIGPVTLY